jgi:hypothetical protein
VAAPRNLFLVLTLAASAGVHATLAPMHVAEGAGVLIMFGLSAAVLGATAVAVDRCPRPAAYSLAALVLGTLLAAYLASRRVTYGRSLMRSESTRSAP